MLISAQIEDTFEEEAVVMLEPRNKDLGSCKKVLVAKTLVVIGQEVHAHHMNINFHTVTLRNGTVWDADHP